MNEKEFWAELYLLLNKYWPPEMESLGFCDWIEVRNYWLGGNEPHIEGKIGLIGGSASEIRFVFFLNGNPEALSDIKWHASVPRPGSANWILFDRASKILELNPMKVS
ncbi:MAG: hypothetical protein AAFR91_00080 [Pseudomonadota bacterium]